LTHNGIIIIALNATCERLLHIFKGIMKRTKAGAEQPSCLL